METDVKKSKTYEDYLAEEPVYPGESIAVRQVYAVRRMIQDRLEGMTTAERVAYYNKHGAYKPAAHQ